MQIKYRLLIGAGYVAIALTLYLVYVYYYVPTKEQAVVAEQVAEEKQKIAATSSDPIYKNQINFAIDGFSGYCVFRSPVFQNELARKSVKVNLQDIGDYNERFESLKSGKTQMGVFTIDALLKVSQKGQLPVSILAIADETRGGDGACAYKETIPNIDALNDPNVKFVVTANSPSETLARVVMANFKLDSLNQDPFTFVKDAEEVYKIYRTSNPKNKQVFVLWEPYISKVVENPGMHVVIDSSRFQGYIVDVIVANRDFIATPEGAELAKSFVSSYFKAAYHYRNDMKTLVKDDARSQGTPLTDIQADNLVKGIWWKNTQENYAHFGMGGTGVLQHVQSMIENLTAVLLKTKAITVDPVEGKPNLLVYDKILTSLHNENFHPGLTSEKIGKQAELVSLSDSEWDRLIPVGTLEVQPLVFNRGTSRLSPQSVLVLDGLIKTLNTFPQYYLLIEGNASMQGDLTANKALAATRAKAAQDYLLSHGINKNRAKAVSGEPTGMTSVRFVLGQVPY
jgi:flagellar motor protein MotB